MKRSSWAEVLILPITLSALTLCWLTLWQQWVLAVGGYTGPAISPILMLLVLVVGAFVTRWSVAAAPNNLQLEGPQRIVMVTGLISVVAVLWITFGTKFPFDFAAKLTEWKHFISPQLLALAVAGLLWWRSIHLGRDEDLHASAQREFSGGILALAVLFVFNQVSPQLTTAQAFWPILSFFALGLGSLALAGFEQDKVIQNGLSQQTNRHWLGTVGLIIGLILTGAVMVAALASPETLAAVDPILDWVGVTLINLIGLVLYAITLVLFPIGEAIGQLLWPILHLFVTFSSGFQLRDLGPTPEQINDIAQQLARTPPFRLFEIALCVLALLIVFRLAVRRLRRRPNTAGQEDQHESIFSRDLLLSQLKNLWRPRPASAPAQPPYLALDGLDDPRLRIRQAYQQFLAWAAQHQQARLPHQTPTLLAQSLAESLPNFNEELATLASIYSRARYGLAVTPQDAQQAQNAVQRLAQAGKPN